MSNRKSGDEEDNTCVEHSAVYEELPNIPFKDFGWMWPIREGYHVNGPSEEICIKRFVKDEDTDKLKAVNEMFANLGEELGTNSKSSANLLFNT